jgi:eukaryotic-like serine/threonine-protein kinase
MAAEQRFDRVRIVGRYAIYGQIAAGGMATVHLGRLLGPSGFTRTVAIKRLHEAYVADPEFSAMFIDEARLAARVRHPNVLQTLDLLSENGELLLVVEYVQGRTLAQLLELATEHGTRIPHRISAAILSGVLQGLHAAHDARDEHGRLLGLVHRDVSPQNILLGLDGVARVLDFGIAKAEGRLQMTREGQVKGKLGYIAPEQVDGHSITHRADIYAAAVVLWEALTGRRLIEADTPATMIARMLDRELTPPSRIVPGLPRVYDEVVLRGMAPNPADRFANARDMALALEACDGVESNAAVGVWLEQLLGAAAAEPALDDPIDFEREVDELMDAGIDDAPTEQVDPPTLELLGPRSMLEEGARAELLSASDWELTRPEPSQRPPPLVALPPASADVTQRAARRKAVRPEPRGAGSRLLLALDAVVITAAALLLSFSAVRDPAPLSSSEPPVPVAEALLDSGPEVDSAPDAAPVAAPALSQSAGVPRTPKAPRRWRAR